MAKKKRRYKILPHKVRVTYSSTMLEAFELEMKANPAFAKSVKKMQKEFVNK